jgi:hypothetical protein
LKRIKISLFVGISKSLKLIVFGQILTKSGNFGQIQLLWQWLTTFAKSDKLLRAMACWKAL